MAPKKPVKRKAWQPKENQGWNKLEQGSVNAVFGVKNGEWRAYWQLRTDAQKSKRWKYINPADNVTYESFSSAMKANGTGQYCNLYTNMLELKNPKAESNKNKKLKTEGANLQTQQNSNESNFKKNVVEVDNEAESIQMQTQQNKNESSFDENKIEIDNEAENKQMQTQKINNESSLQQNTIEIDNEAEKERNETQQNNNESDMLKNVTEIDNEADNNRTETQRNSNESSLKKNKIEIDNEKENKRMKTQQNNNEVSLQKNTIEINNEAENKQMEIDVNTFKNNNEKTNDKQLDGYSLHANKSEFKSASNRKRPNILANDRFEELVHDANLLTSGTRRFELNSTSTYEQNFMRDAEFYKIETAKMNKSLKEELDNDDGRKLVVLKISSTLRTVEATYINRKYLTLGEEISRDAINSSLVQVCSLNDDDIDLDEEWCYGRDDIKRVLKLDKINTDNLNDNLCLHKVTKITKNIVVTINKKRKLSNDKEIHPVLEEFAESRFLLGYLYKQSNGSVYFEDLGDEIDSFEDKLNEEIKYPVFFFEEEEINNTSLAEIIRDL